MSTSSQVFDSAFFDEASAAWMANKRRVGASYVYRCIHIGRNGTPCKNKPWKLEDVCYFHLGTFPTVCISK